MPCCHAFWVNLHMWSCTGSQYPLLNTAGDNTREFTDAIDNLNFALDCVVKYPVGVYLAFHHHLIHAQTALKIHTTELDAFSGKNAAEPISHSSIYIVHDNDLHKAARFNCLSLMMQPLDLVQRTLPICKPFAKHRQTA